MLTSCDGELPNPHKNCVRQILASLVCLDHDLMRINIELRNVQEEYQREVDTIEKKCTMLRATICGEPLSICDKIKRSSMVESGRSDASIRKDGGDELRVFSKQLHTIDEVNECFKGKIEKVKQQRNEVLENGRQYMLQLLDEKCKFKRFHEKTIEHLKSLIIKSDDPIVICNCEKDISNMQQQFIQEVDHLKRTERTLYAFFNHLKQTDVDYFAQSCCFKQYEWLPPGKNFEEVDKIAAIFKEKMGETLKRAFAQLHIHQPEDPKAFLAGYLINVYRNEKILAEKLTILDNINKETNNNASNVCGDVPAKIACSK